MFSSFETKIFFSDIECEIRVGNRRERKGTPNEAIVSIALPKGSPFSLFIWFKKKISLE